ncbi:MAG: arsenate reductase ArsC [Thermoplasmatota archaeon]
MSESKKTVLFLCTHNSCRSQMAEGLLNAMYPDRFKAFSAGIQKKTVNPNALQVMKEIGIDISMHYSKLITDFQGKEFDYVVTVCDNVKETCPYFPGKHVIHKSFQDPSSFKGDADETLIIFRRVRDEIKFWIEKEFG